MKKVLVTGASGYIGRYSLKPLFEKGYEVYACYSKEIPKGFEENVTWVRCNLLDSLEVESLVREVQPTHLLHFAWYAVPGKFWNAEENMEWVATSLYLLKHFSRCGQRVVFAGTSAEYNWEYGFCREDITPLEPSSLYGVSKHSLQQIFSSYCKQNQINSAWGRIFFLYGPGEPKEKLVSGLIQSLLLGKLFETSSGEQIRDFLYVEDVADAFVALLDSEVAGNVNIASGFPLKVKDLILKIAGSMDKINLVKIGAKPSNLSEPTFLLADTSRLSNIVKWKPTRTLEEGIQLTIDWWKKDYQ